MHKARRASFHAGLAWRERSNRIARPAFASVIYLVNFKGAEYEHD